MNGLLQLTLEDNPITTFYAVEVTHRDGSRFNFRDFQEFFSYWCSHPEITVDQLSERHIHIWSINPIDPNGRFATFLVKSRLPEEPVIN